MNQLRRLVLPVVVAGLALTAWSSTASAGEYVGKFRPGNHQSNSVPAVHPAVPVRSVTSPALAPMQRAGSASSATSSHVTHATHAAPHFGNSHNAVLPH